jgi:hypothetical protein
MTRARHPFASLLGIISVLLGARLSAQEAFAPPQAYPLDRYEAGWSKNPFTLKTAPVALAQKSFAEDLAIGSYYGAKENPTVVIVNVKTKKRWPLQMGQTAENGMMLSGVSITSSRRDTMVEVKLNGETAELRFDDSFIKEMAVPTPGAGPGSNGAGPGAGRETVNAANPNTVRDRPRLNRTNAASDTATVVTESSSRPSFPGAGEVADAGAVGVTASPGYIPTRERRMKFTTPISHSNRQGPKPTQPPQ